MPLHCYYYSKIKEEHMENRENFYASPTSYLKNKMESFQPTEEEEFFINNSLFINNKNQIKIDQFFIYLVVFLIKVTYSSFILFLIELKEYSQTGILLCISLFATQILSLICLKKKYLIGKNILLLQFLLLAVYAIAFFDTNQIFNLLNAIGLFAYVLLSKRVKYTLVEKINP